MNLKQLSKYLLWVLLAGCKQPATGPLYQVVIDNKVGYIDSTGHIIIPAKYLAGDYFSEGLASVRLEGNYGYIDTTGKWAIPPQYDYATPFSEERAVVYINGLAGCIDRKGALVVQPVFAHITAFEKGHASVETCSNKKGVINRQGILIADTVFSSIEPFIDGYSIVAGDSSKGEFAVIDSTGRFLVHYGQYHLIEANEGGYIRVHFRKDQHEYAGFIDGSGKLVFSMRNDLTERLVCNPHEGIFLVIQGKMLDSGFYETDAYYVNMQGEQLFKGKGITLATDFYEGRAFVQCDGEGGYYLYDRSGRQKGNNKVSEVISHFSNGIAIVETEDHLTGIIDTNGVYVYPPARDHRDYRNIYGNYIFFSANANNEVLWGFIDIKTRLVMPPTMRAVDDRGFVNGLLQCNINKKLTYVNTAGKIIWQQKGSFPPAIQALNTDVISYEDYLAKDEPSSEPFIMSGDAGIATPEDLKWAANLRLIAYPSVEVIRGHYSAFKVDLINHTGRSVNIDADGNELRMAMQALAPDGKWKDIERRWAYNQGYNEVVTIPAGKTWTYKCTRYTGAYKTKLRMALNYSKDGKGIIYSNEFDGSINPGQTWRSREETQPLISYFINRDWD